MTRSWAPLRRLFIAACADLFVISICAMARAVAQAGDRGLVPQICAGSATYLGVWVWLYHRDARGDAS